MPAVCFKALGRIVSEPALHLAIDGNTVVIIDGNQLAQPQRAGQRAGFVGDTFHQTTITQKYPGVVIDNGVTIAVELRGQRFFGDRHAHRIGQTLTQRASCGLNAWRVAELWVPGRLTVQLSELFNVLD